MTKLFKVSVTATFVVAEPDLRSAGLNALPYCREHLDDAAKPFDNIAVSEITSREEIPEGWKLAIPYGDDSDGSTHVFDFFKN